MAACRGASPPRAKSPTDSRTSITTCIGGAMRRGATNNAVFTAETAASEQQEYPVGAKFWFTVLSLVILLILGGLDGNIVATAVPSITDYFHTVADVGWYLSAYKLCVCSFQFLFGKLYNIFPVKSILLTAIATFLIGSVLSSTARSSTMFIVGRAVTGLGAAGIFAGAFTAAVHIMPLRWRPVFNATLAGIESVAVISAPLLGGVLVQSLSWRWCFYINLPIGGLALIVTLFFFPDLKAHADSAASWRTKLAKLDLLSTAVFVPALTCLFIALSWAGLKYPWSDARVIVLFALFALLFTVFGYIQHRKGDDALLPLRIMKQRSIMAGLVFSLCTNGAMNVLEFYIPTYYQAVREYSPAKSGYMMAPILAGFMIAVILNGAGTTIWGYYVPSMMIASILMPLASGLMTTWQVSTSFAQLIIYSALAGFAGGIGFQAPQSAVQTVLPASDVPLGLSVILFAQNFGPALFVAVAQTIFTNQLSTNLKGLGIALSPGEIEKLGLTDLKRAISPTLWKDTLDSIDKSLVQTWYLVIGLTCVTMIGSLSMEWRSVKEKRQ
ncbi:efflux pump antibiotic resistance protein [Trichoderma sp. TUCIM 5745]